MMEEVSDFNGGNLSNEDYWFWICNIKDVWHGTIKKLLSEYQSPQELYNAEKVDILYVMKKLQIKDESLLDRIIDSRNIEKIYEKKAKLEKKDIKFVSIENEKYPTNFFDIDDTPYGFYYIGNIDKINDFTVSIVGARNCTSYGKDIAKRLGFELAVNGINVVSGMARGIDTYGHLGCIEAGGTPYAILGCGVDICYPRENIDIYEKIKETGAIISDYQIGSPPVNWQFPLRNRLISALSEKIVVVEAREKSGSLITVNYGLEQGKDICAVPGRIGDALSQGCNRLIKEGAALVLDAKDIIEELNILAKAEKKNNGKNNYTLAKDLEMLYSCVDFIPKSLQQLCEETGMDTAKLLGNLIKLQMEKLIEEPTKNYYIRKI